MNGNTLTTERVRSSFIWAEEESPAQILPSVLGEEFDRWLAGVKAEAWEEGQDAELERPADEPPRSNPYRGENK